MNTSPTPATVQWNYPTAVKVGVGRIAELTQHCQSLGMKKVLIVTDPGLASMPVLDSVKQALQALQPEVFSQIKGNPTGKNVQDGVAFLRAKQCDGVVAFGGGSALDAGKAIALMAGQTLPLWDFEDVGDNYLRVRVQGMLPVVAVPTTAGTGSEVGRVSVITHEDEQRKVLIFHPKIMPAIVILDAAVTTGLPAKLTAATGMDAMSHALEAYCSPFYHPMAKAIGMESIKMIFANLRQAVQHPNDLHARQEMLVASMMGATAFQRGLGAMHALAHPLGAVYDAHHGLLNAILMPYVLTRNRTAIESSISDLARYLNLSQFSFDAFLEAVLTLRKDVGIPHTLQEIGIDGKQSKKIGEMAAVDPSAGTNPITLSASDYESLFLQALGA